MSAPQQVRTADARQMTNLQKSKRYFLFQNKYSWLKFKANLSRYQNFDVYRSMSGSAKQIGMSPYPPTKLRELRWRLESFWPNVQLDFLH